MQLVNFLIVALFFIDFYSPSDALIQPNAIIPYNFLKWQRKYKEYKFTPSELYKAYQNFRVAYMATLRHQIKYYTYRSDFQMKVNKYAVNNTKVFLNGALFDDKPAEPNAAVTRAFNLPAYPTPPPSLDYRNMGLVTDVEDQGYCSSCYAFAAVCGLESQIAKKYNRLNSLSSQNIVDCSRNYGCDGGSIGMAFNYIVKNSGIANETSYPYSGLKETCKYNTSILAEKAISYTYVTGDENYLKSVLAAVGPLPVGMKGSVESFYYYSSGIYDDPACTTQIDHAVCLVGYGTDNSTSPPTNYWIVKNSWSTDWGENGYFRLKMGSNLCGIRNYVVYPNV